MTQRQFPLVIKSLGLISFLTIGACNFRAYSPPAGWVPAESVAPLAPDQSSIAGSLHLGRGVFGPGIGGGSVSLRHGLTDSYEVQGNVSYLHVIQESRTTDFKGIVTGRVGLKGLFDPEFKHLSWNASLGGGGHTAGGFISPEAGLQIGYENPYLTPWLRTSLFLSQPLGATAIDIAPKDEAQADLDTPQTTFGVRVAVGLSISWDEALPLRIHLLSEMVYFNRVDGSDDGIFGFGIGVETLL